MQDKQSTKERVVAIIEELVATDSLSMIEKFAIIGSNSVQCIVFLSALEDEFDIEIDDDHINARFFSDIDYVTDCILGNVK